ncbi:MAG: hypothetical protein ACREUX_22590, partial [Burkholderiales bacterium]
MRRSRPGRRGEHGLRARLGTNMHISSDAKPASGERPMPKYIRRSMLALSIDDPDLEAKAFASWADAIVLDFDKPTGLDWQASIHSRMPAAIGSAARSGAKVFVRADCNAARAELDAAVFLGIAGVVLKQVRDAQGVVRAAEYLAELETARGIDSGSIE